MSRWPANKTSACRAAVRKWLQDMAAVTDADFSCGQVSKACGFDVAKVGWVLNSMLHTGEVKYRYASGPAGGRRVFWRWSER